MKKIDSLEAQAEIDNLKIEDITKRRLRRDPWPELTPHAAEIMAWAKANGGSKYKIKRLFHTNFGLKISAHRIYRFVRSINGDVWTHPRSIKGKK